MKFFILLLLICLPVFSETQIIELSENIQEVTLGAKVYYLIDKEDKLTIDDIASANNQNLFIRNASNIVEFGYVKSPIWLRLTVKELNLKPRNWFLEIAYPLLDKIEFYSLDGGKWVTKYTGDKYPFSNRELFYRNFGFSQSFQPVKEQTFYIKIQTTSAAIIPLTLYQEELLLKKILYTENWHLIYYGVLLVMIFYNGFIFLSFRSISYLLYSLSTLSMLGYQVMFNGHGFQYLWSNNIWLQQYAGLIAITLFAFFTFEFMIRFLDLPKNIRFYLRALLILQNIIIFTNLYYSLSTAFKLIGIAGLFNVVIFISIGIISWIKGYRAARFFVVAWGGYCLGSILASLRIMGLVDTNFITTYSLQIGSMVELVFLSIALADRYKLIMDENIRVQKNLLEIQIVHTNTLEEKVKERTATLDNTLNKLNQSMSLIRDDLMLAKKIQKNILQIKPSILKELSVIQTYLPMSEVGGDFYDITKINDSTYRIFQADATGHGVQAAMITMAIKGIYDNIKNFDLETSEIMEIFNDDYLHKYQSLNSFMTAILVDINVKRQVLKYTSAGHPAAVLLKNDNTHLLKNTGKMIGVIKNAKYTSLELQFNRGDRLYIFTDGIFEEFNTKEEEFGEERLHSILEETSKNASIQDSIKTVLDALDTFLESQDKQDDITVIGIEYPN